MASKKSAAAAAKPKALSVHIGLNAVSAGHYGGWSRELAAPAAVVAGADRVQADVNRQCLRLGRSSGALLRCHSDPLGCVRRAHDVGAILRPGGGRRIPKTSVFSTR